jgi:hypothetical protein
MMIQDVGRTIVSVGFILIVVGIFFCFLARLPFFGKLPGDILIKRENFTFYAPIATGILISIILSVLFIIISSLRR